MNITASNSLQPKPHTQWDHAFRAQAEAAQYRIDVLRRQRDAAPGEQVERDLAAAHQERTRIARERHQEGLRLGYIAPPLTMQELARRNIEQGRAWVITLTSGEQYLVPTYADALETADVHGGCIDSASIFKVPGELYGHHRYRPNYKWDTPWRDWPEWSDDTTRHANEEPLTAEQLGALETEGRVSEMLVEGWLPAAGVNPLVGDSGLGKTPLVLQLGACVASGTDFLGLPTKQGKVLICDYENLGLLSAKLREVSKAIGVDFDADVAPDLRFLNSPTPEEIFKAARQGNYALVIVDALRGLSGGQEIDPKIIVPLLTKMSKIPACWILLHHIRKGDKKNPPPDLGDLTVRVLSWLEEAAGSRAIVNQTFTRLGVIAPKTGADIFIRGFVKGYGERGPLMLERVHAEDEPERPIGYQIARDWALLPDAERGAYQRVAGQTLSWRELAATFGKNPATRLLEACRNNRLVTEVGKAHRDRRYIFRPLVIETEEQAVAHALDRE